MAFEHIVMARFDETTEAAIAYYQQSLQRAACIKTVSKYPPHMTMAMYEGLSPESIVAWTRDRAQKHAQVPVRFSSVGIFPPAEAGSGTLAVFLALAMSPGLMALYADFHERYDEHCGDDGWLYSMAYGYPVPHATIAIVDLEGLDCAIAQLTGDFRQMEGRIVSIEVYASAMRLLASVPLGA